MLTSLRHGLFLAMRPKRLIFTVVVLPLSGGLLLWMLTSKSRQPDDLKPLPVAAVNTAFSQLIGVTESPTPTAKPIDVFAESATENLRNLVAKWPNGDRFPPGPYASQIKGAEGDRTQYNEALKSLVGVVRKEGLLRSLDWAKSLPDDIPFEFRQSILISLVDTWGESDPGAALVWSESLPKGQIREIAVAKSLMTLGRVDAPRAWEQAVAVFRADHYNFAFPAIVHYWCETDPVEAAKAVASLPDGAYGAFTVNVANQLLASWMSYDQVGAVAWVVELPAGRLRDAAVARLNELQLNNSKLALFNLARIYLAPTPTNQVARRMFEYDKTVILGSVNSWSQMVAAAPEEGTVVVPAFPSNFQVNGQKLIPQSAPLLSPK